MNFFELYNIPLSFSPDRNEVKKQYFQLSRKYHPDFVSNGTDADKEEALEVSAKINKAYKVLNNSDETVKYVLQLKGLLQDDEKYDLPKDFLIEMMDVNESLMDAKMENDEAAINKCKSSIATFSSEIYEPVKEIIEKNTDVDFTQEKMLQVKDYYFKKKYLNRILDSIS